MRWRILLTALCVAVPLGVTLNSPSALSASAGGALSASAGGDFIVRCFFNSNVAPMDPILDPGSSHSDELHMFFGNNIQGTTSFPSITSGDSGGTGTMENNGRSTPTNCQDTNDTAGYWQPEPYLNGTPWLGPGGGCTSDCSASSNMHLRVYYLPNATSNGGTPLPQEIPDGTIMVTGFPNGCVGVTGHGCDTGNTWPNDFNIVRYDCGADNNTDIVTPASAWPYNCNLYHTDSDDTFNDGIVAFTDFPDCWNGNRDWSPPNGAPSAPKVPGYVAPWIPDPSAPTSGGQRLNDFTYVSPGGTCPSGFPYAVPQIEERMHLLTNSNPQLTAHFGEPSTCSNEGTNWNTDNAELTDGGPAPHTCPPPPNPLVPPSGINLSFSCGHGGDTSNCTVDTGQLGCTSGIGHCFIGANPVGWETLYADYWQTWQEGGGNDVFPESSQGAFTDLVEDCTNEGMGACSFINNTVKNPYPSGRVFGETSSNT